MKKIIALSFVPIIAGFIWVGCAGEPTRVERWLFNIQTNYVPVTNMVVAVNPDGSKVTNAIVSVAPVYIPTKGQGETTVTEIGTEVGNVFGVGGLVTTAMGVLFGAWRWIRGNKAAQTADALAQNIEMIREFVKQLPNGTTYDNVLTSWLTQHQAEAGVLQQVIGILKTQVSNPEAKAAADQVTATIEGLLKK
jgi:hypothetical protein